MEDTKVFEEFAQISELYSMYALDSKGVVPVSLTEFAQNLRASRKRKLPGEVLGFQEVPVHAPAAMAPPPAFEKEDLAQNALTLPAVIPLAVAEQEEQAFGEAANEVHTPDIQSDVEKENREQVSSGVDVTPYATPIGSTGPLNGATSMETPPNRTEMANNCRKSAEMRLLRNPQPATVAGQSVDENVVDSVVNGAEREATIPVGESFKSLVFDDGIYNLDQSYSTAYITAMALLLKHKAKEMSSTDAAARDSPDLLANKLNLRENHIVSDFAYDMVMHRFKTNERKPIVVTLLYKDGVSYKPREVVDMGGVSKYALSVMLDTYVYSRLKLLQSNGQTPTPNPAGYYSKDWDEEMLLSGSLCSHAMVQGLLCPWWILRAYQGIMAGGSGGLDHKFCEGLKTLDGIAILQNQQMWPLFVKQQVTVDIIMETLNFDFKVSKSFFKRQLEVQNKEWFQNWLKSLDGVNGGPTLTNVYCWLTGSSHIPVAWREVQCDVTYRHQKSENDWTHPSCSTCFSTLSFPIVPTEVRFIDMWNHTVHTVHQKLFTRM